MKKTLLALSLLAGLSAATHAQVNTGGLPLSQTSGEAALSNQYYSPVYYDAPDKEALLQADAQASRMKPGPYRAGMLVATDVSFPQSGSLVTLADGRMVWRAQVSLGDVPALIFYYDRFQLPEGVRFFISNANGRQVLGAFTSANNSDDGRFASRELQGGIANLELDIDPKVNLEDIKLHINQAAAMYRTGNYLQRYAGTDPGTAMRPTTDFAQGLSSVCEVNAICPAGQSYPEQRKATVRIVIPVGGGFVGFCTGTLINNTKGDCTPYILTATHCEESSSVQDATFSQWLFYFNFESPDCAGTVDAPNVDVLQGATFVSRASYNQNSAAILGDFLLVKLKNAVKPAYNVYFAGWDRSTSQSGNNLFINFHHPSGDMKKLAVANSVSPSGTFNQFQTQGTHWEVNFSTGGNEGGSSGSALFNTSGRIIGDLSGGADVQACDADTNAFGDQATLGQEALFSKLSRNWEYPEGNSVQTAQLKPWLDPLNSGAMTTNTIAAAATCNSPVTTGISDRDAAFGDAVSLYPNPVVSGTLRMRVNLEQTSDLTVAIYDITGARKAVYQIGNARNSEYSFDMSGYAQGSYLISISNGTATTAKKVMLVR